MAQAADGWKGKLTAKDMRSLDDITPAEWDALRASSTRDLQGWEVDLEEAVEEATHDKGTKYDGGKLRMDLITPEMMEGLARPLTYGVEKYDDHNWRKGLSYSRVTAAALRHLNKWRAGHDIDDEADPITGAAPSYLPHIQQAFVNIGFLVTFELEGRKELDDRYKGDTK